MGRGPKDKSALLEDGMNNCARQHKRSVRGWLGAKGLNRKIEAVRG